MADSVGTSHGTSMAAAEEETNHLLGVEPEIESHQAALEAELACGRKIAARPSRRRDGCLPFGLFPEKKKLGVDTVPVAEKESKHLQDLAWARKIAATTLRRARACLRLVLLGGNKDGADIVPVARPLDHRDLNKYREEKERLIRSMMPGHFERLAMDRQFVEECLRHYNTMHPGDEYEPAPGELTRYGAMRKNKVGWTHGNFVARRKRNGCFSIFPAPRTIFFFELMSCDNFEGVVTCTPLDEPVTEAYSIMGFPLWWTTRRNGKMDCICKTCYRHYEVPHPFIIKKTYPCGHGKVERVCEMCYLSSGVLHPFPGEFAYGYREYSYLHC